ncbi:hypothetical protein ACJX0J_005406 [Zea mays]
MPVRYKGTETSPDATLHARHAVLQKNYLFQKLMHKAWKQGHTLGSIERNLPAILNSKGLFSHGSIRDLGSSKHTISRAAVVDDRPLSLKDDSATSLFAGSNQITNQAVDTVYLW